MRKSILISTIFAIILLSLSGCLGMHHMSHVNVRTANNEITNYVQANHGTNNHSGGCH